LLVVLIPLILHKNQIPQMMQNNPSLRAAYGLFIITTFIGIFGCKTQNIPNKTAATNKPIPHQTLIEKPFGFEPTIRNFSKKIIPPYKIQRYAVKNQHKTNETDSIYRFYYKKSELFIFKSKFGKEIFFAGNIVDKKIVLMHGIRVGISRKTFFDHFTDVKYTPDDTIKLTSKARMTNYKFVFKKDKLEGIKIDAYID
jgi:hypothetical protein